MGNARQAERELEVAKVRAKRRLATALSVLVTLLVPPLAVAQDAASEPAGTGRLAGRVVRGDGAAANGATVLAYHLSSEQLFRHEATDAKGKFEIAALPYGYFDIAVVTSEGLFVADGVVNLPPAGKTSVSLTLLPGTNEGTLRAFPGTDAATVGVAAIDRKSATGSFWGSPAGIGIIAGAGVIALVSIAGGGDDEPASP